MVYNLGINISMGITIGQQLLVSISTIDISNMGHFDNIGPDIDRYYRVNIVSVPQNLIQYCQYILKSAYI